MSVLLYVLDSDLPGGKGGILYDFDFEPEVPDASICQLVAYTP